MYMYQVLEMSRGNLNCMESLSRFYAFSHFALLPQPMFTFQTVPFRVSFRDYLVPRCVMTKGLPISSYVAYVRTSASHAYGATS